jgi:hypothetical protein
MSNTALAGTPAMNGHTMAMSVPPAPKPKELMVISADDMVARFKHIQIIREKLMKKGVHYDSLFSGANKDSMKKEGADMLGVAFQFAPRYEITDLSTSDEIRYRIRAELYTIGGDVYVGSGVGECSSNEEKYKWREAVCDAEYEKCPDNRRRIKYRKSGGDISEIKQIRTEPADLANTILKMGKKRAWVDGILTTTGASDMFEQDLLEELPEGMTASEAASGKPVYYIKSIEEKETSNGKIKFIVHTTNGKKFDTFFGKFKNLAQSLLESKKPAYIEFEVTKWGNNMKDIKAAPEQPPASSSVPSPELMTAIGVMVSNYKLINVTVEMIEANRGKKIDQLTEQDVKELTEIGEFIASKLNKVTDFFKVQ